MKSERPTWNDQLQTQKANDPPGRVLVGDAEWSAEADEVLPVGAPVRVLARRNLTLRVTRA